MMRQTELPRTKSILKEMPKLDFGGGLQRGPGPRLSSRHEARRTSPQGADRPAFQRTGPSRICGGGTVWDREIINSRCSRRLPVEGGGGDDDPAGAISRGRKT